MTTRKSKISDDQMQLLQLPEKKPDSEPKVKVPQHPIWTENKAKLIERYLYYFVMVTHHGTYIDGFSGPQTETDSDTWTAKLVLNSEPRWLRNFFLVEQDPNQVRLLQELKTSQPKLRKRRILVYQGDCNTIIPALLKKHKLPEEASFCLLDQRTTECAWSTVSSVASYKQENKIEIFYFLMNAWFERTIAAVGDKRRLDAWFGNSNWNEFASMKSLERARFMCARFRNELGYKSAKPWAIYDKPEGHGKIMYYMIHATDHLEAPKLMARAYQNAIKPKEKPEQLALWLRVSPPEI